MWQSQMQLGTCRIVVDAFAGRMVEGVLWVVGWKTAVAIAGKPG